MQHDFRTHLAESDPELFASIQQEYERQRDQIELIASENIVSQAVLDAQGSVLTNKYAEGYPNKRYYGGCEFVDIAETLAIERAKKLFGCSFANVQPHSGSQANQAVFMSLLTPGDTILGMDLSAGGHLTHGSPVNMSGKWFKVVSYGVKQSDMLIDYAMVEKLALEHKPKLIIAGVSSYSRFIDFKIFKDIADKVGAFLLVDMAHFAGLVAANIYHQSPLPYAHVVTTTTHKTLRGPRGGMILSNHEDIGKKINSAVFPGIQGGPLMHVIAAKAVAFKEALTDSYKEYIQQVVRNAQTLASNLTKHGFNIVSGGTDTHLMLVDLRPKKITGKFAEDFLEACGITCNKNGIPFDTEKPTITSGIRLGSPACTTRGFKEKECDKVGDFINEALEESQKTQSETARADLAISIKKRVKDFCGQSSYLPPYSCLAYEAT